MKKEAENSLLSLPFFFFGKRLYRKYSYFKKEGKKKK
jgi:hypothetical protein